MAAGPARALAAQPATFDFAIPPQSAAKALLAFSKVTQANVLFPYDELDRVNSPGVAGRHEPEAALELLLAGTGYTAQHNRANRFGLVKIESVTGVITGRLLTATGQPAADVSLDLLGAGLSEITVGYF